MQIGTEFQCEIEKTVFGGDGLARCNGEVVFLPRTLPGERLIGRVTAVKKNFSRAEVVRFGQKNPRRIEPGCSYFGRCPGCCYRHAEYALEAELKSAQLADLLVGAGIEPAPGVIAPFAAPLPEEGYRDKIVLHVHKSGGRTELGYVMADNTTVTDIERCPLAHPEINAELARLRVDRSFLHSLHEGMDVTFRRTDRDGVRFWRNRPAANLTWLRETVPFGELSVPCGSFFQVNPAGCAVLVAEFEAVLERLSPRRVIDLYCGVGLFAAAAAHRGVRDILAVESDEAAAAACRYNLRRYGIAEPEVIAGDAADAFGRNRESDPAGTLLVVDPPRTGLSPQALRNLVESPLRFLVYISCNPATWARDALRLRKGGFELNHLRGVNMFPRTGHFELFSFWTREPEARHG